MDSHHMCCSKSWEGCCSESKHQNILKEKVNCFILKFTTVCFSALCSFSFVKLPSLPWCGVNIKSVLKQTPLKLNLLLLFLFMSAFCDNLYISISMIKNLTFEFCHAARVWEFLNVVTENKKTQKAPNIPIKQHQSRVCSYTSGVSCKNKLEWSPRDARQHSKRTTATNVAIKHATCLVSKTQDNSVFNWGWTDQSRTLQQPAGRWC